jgi:hypothetical protein
MLSKPNPRRACTDAAVQRAILALVLGARPMWRTIPELAREIDCGDTVERAVVDLVGIGLLECRGVSLRPTPALIHFNNLELP